MFFVASLSAPSVVLPFLLVEACEFCTCLRVFILQEISVSSLVKHWKHFQHFTKYCTIVEMSAIEILCRFFTVSKFVKFQVWFLPVFSHFYIFSFNSRLIPQHTSKSYYQCNHIENAVLSQNTWNFFFFSLFHLEQHCTWVFHPFWKGQLVLRHSSIILWARIRLGVYVNQLSKKVQIKLCCS